MLTSYYDITLATLKIMDATQLSELMKDINCPEVIGRIYCLASEFLENHEAKSNEKSDENDWKELDDTQRLRDLK